MKQEPEQGRIFNPDPTIRVAFKDVVEINDDLVPGIEELILQVRAKTIEELRVLIVTEKFDAGTMTGYCETCAEFAETGYSLNLLNDILDKAKKSKPLWQK